jgi:hypothetical protein
MESPEHQAQLIRNFLRLKDPDDAVVHLEKVASEGIFGRHYDVWDVHTDRGRWWVITNPPFRYDQTDFKSMDVALSFHVGLMQRVVAHRAPLVPQQERDRLAAAWRKWTQAAEALDEADEAEEFQSVAMRARESLLSLTRALRKDEMVPEGETPPQWDNFTGWAELIAQAIAQGRLRSYLIGVAKESWQYVNFLTHDQNANRFDAEIAIDVASNVLLTYGRAFLRWESAGRTVAHPAPRTASLPTTALGCQVTRT